MNNLAWDIVLWQLGGRKKPTAGQHQVCIHHKRIKIGHRLSIARTLDKRLLNRIPEPTIFSEADSIVAMAAQNGHDFPHAKLPSGRRILERDDRYPAADSLCDYGSRAQKAEAFYEAWMLEVTAGIAAKSGHRGRPHVRTPPEGNSQDKNEEEAGVLTQYQQNQSQTHQVAAMQTQPAVSADQLSAGISPPTNPPTNPPTTPPTTTKPQEEADEAH